MLIIEKLWAIIGWHPKDHAIANKRNRRSEDSQPELIKIQYVSTWSKEHTATLKLAYVVVKNSGSVPKARGLEPWDRHLLQLDSGSAALTLWL